MDPSSLRMHSIVQIKSSSQFAHAQPVLIRILLILCTALLCTCHSLPSHALLDRWFGPPAYLMYRLLFPLSCVLGISALERIFHVYVADNIAAQMRTLLALTSFIVSLLLSNRISKVKDTLDGRFILLINVDGWLTHGLQIEMDVHPRPMHSLSIFLTYHSTMFRFAYRIVHDTGPGQVV